MIDRVIAFGTRIVTTVDAWLQRYRLTRWPARRSWAAGPRRPELRRLDGVLLILSFVNVLLLGAVLLTAFIGEGEARRVILTWFAQNTPIDPGPDRAR